MYLQQISDPKLGQHAYLIGCQETGQAIIIDPQRDIDRYLAAAQAAKLRIVAAADTHIHADYLSGLRQFAELPGVEILASAEGGTEWQSEWLVNSPFRYRLLRNRDRFTIGRVRLEAWHTPGHTPEHLVYLVTDTTRSEQPAALLSGDLVFVEDVGRPDLLEAVIGQVGAAQAAAGELRASLQRLRALGPELLLLPGHGAGSACGKSLGLMPISTFGYEAATNRALRLLDLPHEFTDYILRGQPEPPPYFKRMKQLNRGGVPLVDPRARPRQRSFLELAEIIGSPEWVIVDTRAWEQYRTGHLPGALFAPIDKSFTTTIGSFIAPEDRICFVIEPAQLAEALADCRRIGLDRVECYLTPEEVQTYHESGGSMARTDQINIVSLAERMARPDTLALDVRSTAEIAETGMIEGTRNIPHTQLSLRLASLPRERNIHVFCRTGNRSRVSCGYLERQGFRTTLVDGGIEEWRLLDGELVPANEVLN